MQAQTAMEAAAWPGGSDTAVVLSVPGWGLCLPGAGLWKSLGQGVSEEVQRYNMCRVICNEDTSQLLPSAPPSLLHTNLREMGGKLAMVKGKEGEKTFLGH